MTSTLLLKDTSHRTVFPAFTPGGGVGMPELQGAADILMVPDPSTFRILPWAPETGWFLCDLQLSGRAPGAVLHAQPAAATRCEKLSA